MFLFTCLLLIEFSRLIACSEIALLLVEDVNYNLDSWRNVLTTEVKI